MTIDDLKRALVEVREICKKFAGCSGCPFDNKRKAFCVMSKTVPAHWDIDDWKEDTHEAD